MTDCRKQLFAKTYASRTKCRREGSSTGQHQPPQFNLLLYTSVKKNAMGLLHLRVTNNIKLQVRLIADHMNFAKHGGGTMTPIFDLRMGILLVYLRTPDH